MPQGRGRNGPGGVELGLRAGDGGSEMTVEFFKLRHGISFETKLKLLMSDVENHMLPLTFLSTCLALASLPCLGPHLRISL